MKSKSRKIYLCDSCGNEFPAWSGQCQACGAWNSIAEMIIPEMSQSGQSIQSVSGLESMKLAEVKLEKNSRIATRIGEFDRVLGGGIVPASIILIGGEPGIGKSTLLLQTCNNVSNSLYVSAEESLGQIKERANRLGINSGQIELAASGDLAALEAKVLTNKSDLIIIDSIQTVYLNSITGTAGSLMQVRECGIFLQRLAKISAIPIIIVGHVTKDGSLAGPRMLEHIVDVVLYFEGDRYRDARILRGIKNRFGATNEVGIFSIQDRGLVEVKNPSEIFLAEYRNNPGNIVTVVLEGTRPILVEVQALVVPTRFGYPKRTSSGFDLNRLNLLAAVISKTTPINLSNADIYLNVIGGMKLNEPAADLAVCAAMISSHKNRPLAKGLVLFGEVGLSGEVRSVTRQSDREKEIKSLGYTTPPKPENLSVLISQLN
ncbi:MAG: DNA repair protein RadA [Patescibacteria group bacterium]